MGFGGVLTGPSEGLRRLFGGGGGGNNDRREREAAEQSGRVLGGAGSGYGVYGHDPLGNVRPPQTQYPLGLDPDTLRDIDMIRLEGELALAEHAQRVAVANAEAGQQRRSVQRDIGIQNAYRPRAIDLTNQGYNDLVGTLEGIIPLTDQAYDTGVATIGQAYDTGQANLQVPLPQATDLGAQLQGIAGEGAEEFATGVNDPLAYMTQLLGASGDAGQSVLSTLGQGDVAAAYAALPGYRDEQGVAVSDINLETDAALNGLRNELGMITPDFVPFNQAALQLQQEKAIRDAIEEGLNRRREEETFQGYTGAQDLAQRYGRPDLFNELERYMTQANAGQSVDGQAVPPENYIQESINTYGSERLYDDVFRGWGRPDARRGRQNATDIARDRAILQQLLEAYQGNYS